MTQITGAMAGLLFGIGLALSGMLDPSKVTGFLDIFGLWDPSLALVMGGGVTVNAIGYALIRRRPAPVFAPRFDLPQSHAIDRPLIIGAVLFGIGWGLGGLCPGPAVASALLNPVDGIGFVAFLLAGLKLGSVARRRL